MRDTNEDKVNKTVQIYLIRHGLTEANEKKLYCGQIDLPLSENGIKEIDALKNQKIYPEKPVLFFTSGLMRTVQTTYIIYGDVKSITEPLIMEYNFGQFEMKSYEQLKDDDDYQSWITDTTGDFICPGGESKNQFNKSVEKGYINILKEINKQNVNSAMISCHGGVIVHIMEILLPNAKNFYEWQPKAGRGYTLIYDFSDFDPDNPQIREGFTEYKNI